VPFSAQESRLVCACSKLFMLFCNKSAGMGPELFSTYSELFRISLDLLLEGLGLSAAIDPRR